MKRIAFSLFLVVLAACSSGAHSGVSSVPGHGAVALDVTPNPIVAQRVSGDTYDFPFDIVVRETGGHPVNVTRVSATVFAAGGISVGREEWDADRIRAAGYSTTIAANGELRYHFAPRKQVSDDRIFGTLSAELRVEAVDDSGTPTSASTRVTVTR
jgi:hypothetical protein